MAWRAGDIVTADDLDELVPDFFWQDGAPMPTERLEAWLSEVTDDPYVVLAGLTLRVDVLNLLDLIGS